MRRTRCLPDISLNTLLPKPLRDYIGTSPNDGNINCGQHNRARYPEDKVSSRFPSAEQLLRSQTRQGARQQLPTPWLEASPRAAMTSRPTPVRRRHHFLRYCQVIEIKVKRSNRNVMSSVSRCLWDARHLSPRGKRSVPQCSIMLGLDAVATQAEEIGDRSVDRQKSLGVAHRLELPHLSFPLPRRLV